MGIAHALEWVTGREVFRGIQSASVSGLLRAIHGGKRCEFLSVQLRDIDLPTAPYRADRYQVRVARNGTVPAVQSGMQIGCADSSRNLALRDLFVYRITHYGNADLRKLYGFQTGCSAWLGVAGVEIRDDICWVLVGWKDGIKDTLYNAGM